MHIRIGEVSEWADSWLITGPLGKWMQVSSRLGEVPARISDS